jgi:hypothetical protein
VKHLIANNRLISASIRLISLKRLRASEQKQAAKVSEYFRYRPFSVDQVKGISASFLCTQQQKQNIFVKDVASHMDCFWNDEI